MKPVAIAGAGRAGGALARALADRGVPVRVWSREIRSARRLARAQNVTATADLRTLVDGCHALLICVSDDAVAAVARRISRAAGSARPGVALHAAGAHSAELLGSLADLGWSTGVFHPVVALAGPRSAEDLRKGFVTVSGSPPAVRKARALARKLDMRAIEVDDANRPLVHLAAMLAAGDLTELLGAAAGLLARAGVNERHARNLVTHLARGAVDAHARFGPARAATGPVARADVSTLSHHRDALKRARLQASDHALAHRHLVRAAADRLREAGLLNDSQWRAIRRTLPLR